jgi:hypothetical protein
MYKIDMLYSFILFIKFLIFIVLALGVVFIICMAMISNYVCQGLLDSDYE